MTESAQPAGGSHARRLDYRPDSSDEVESSVWPFQEGPPDQRARCKIVSRIDTVADAPHPRVRARSPRCRGRHRNYDAVATVRSPRPTTPDGADILEEPHTFLRGLSCDFVEALPPSDALPISPVRAPLLWTILAFCGDESGDHSFRTVE